MEENSKQIVTMGEGGEIPCRSLWQAERQLLGEVIDSIQRCMVKKNLLEEEMLECFSNKSPPFQAGQSPHCCLCRHMRFCLLLWLNLTTPIDQALTVS